MRFLFYFHTESKFVDTEPLGRLPLPTGQYLVLKCRDHRTMFNPGELNLTERVGISVAYPWTVFQEENWVYVLMSQSPMVAHLQTAHEDVKKGLQEPSFRATVNQCLDRAVMMAREIHFEEVSGEPQFHGVNRTKKAALVFMSSTTPVAELDRLRESLTISSGGFVSDLIGCDNDSTDDEETQLFNEELPR